MKINDLKQLTWLNEEICDLKERRNEFFCAATKTTHKISGLPHLDSFSDNTALTADMVRIIDIIDERIEKTTEEYFRIMEYINLIPDSFIRQIFKYRYIDNLKWSQIAKKTNGRYTADSIRMLHTRYINR